MGVYQKHLRPYNRDMWQRYTDCILCEQKSAPNIQGLLVHKKSRSLLTAFNEVLHITAYERSQPDLEAGMPLDSEGVIEAACLDDFA